MGRPSSFVPLLSVHTVQNAVADPEAVMMATALIVAECALLGLARLAGELNR